MKFLQQLKEKWCNPEKKWASYIVPAFAIGLVFVVSSGVFATKNVGLDVPKFDLPTKQVSSETQVAKDATQSYESLLESRLEAVFASVEGAGKVSVMLTLAYGREVVVAQDQVMRESGTKEVDAQGGTREQFDRNSQGTQIIITGKDGTSQPLIIKEIEPQVEGVVIVAQGGDNVYIKDALIRATQTVLGVEPHKVQVLKMKATAK